MLSFFCACTTPPNYCIVTEFVKRGSLRDVLEDGGVVLDHARQLSMAIDAARGMVLKYYYILRNSVINIEVGVFA